MMLATYKERKTAKLVKLANREFGDVMYDHGDDLSLGETKLNHFGKKIARHYRVMRKGFMYGAHSK